MKIKYFVFISVMWVLQVFVIDIFINEFYYDNLGGDVGEFVEVVVFVGIDLIGYKVFFYNGSNGM